MSPACLRANRDSEIVPVRDGRGPQPVDRRREIVLCARTESVKPTSSPEKIGPGSSWRDPLSWRRSAAVQWWLLIEQASSGESTC